MNSEKYVTYQEAQQWARDNNITNSTAWRMANRPKNIPRTVDKVYKEEFEANGRWIGFLNSPYKRSSHFVSFDEAMKWARENNITTFKQWKGAVLPRNIPSNIDKVYKEEFEANGRWIGFLNSPHMRYNQKKFVTLEEASQWAQANGIATKEQYAEVKDIRPANIPSNPLYTYKEEFVKIGGWSGFLKTTVLRNTSHIERLLALVLDSIFAPSNDVHTRHKAIGASGKKYKVDIMYPQLKLIVEYDGEYYHRRKENSDLAKTTDLISAGWHVIRVRETPLPILDKQWNVSIPQNKKFKMRVESVLLHIAKLDANKFINIAEYRSQLYHILENLDIVPYIKQLMQYKEFVSYDEASQWAKNNHIVNQKQWYGAGAHRPSYIPGDPYDFYGDEFRMRGGWGAFFQTKRVANKSVSGIST